MKKRFLALTLPLLLLPLLSGCGGADYFDYASEVKENIFCAQTDGYGVTVSCVSREYPYIADGISCPRSNVVEISLSSEAKASYEVYLQAGDVAIGGEMSFRTYAGDYFFSQSVEGFFENEVSLRVVKNGESEELVASSIKTERTLSPRDALSCAVAAEKTTIDSMTGKDGFEGEFYIRLIRRDVNYYYVGIINRRGETLSLLLDSETGEVLARRQNS